MDQPNVPGPLNAQDFVQNRPQWMEIVSVCVIQNFVHCKYLHNYSQLLVIWKKSRSTAQMW